MPEHEITHLVTFRLQGPEKPDERGYPRREPLIDVEMRLNELHGGHVASVVLELLSRRGAIVVPAMSEADVEAARRHIQRPVE